MKGERSDDEGKKEEVKLYSVQKIAAYIPDLLHCHSLPP
jgi:hypothetical protein